MHTGRFIWHDLITPDLAGSRAFYEAVLGWNTVEWGGPEDDPFPQPYTMHQAGGAPMPQGGFIPMEGQRASWFANVITDDADALAARVAPAGGTVARGPFDIPTVGRNVIVQDPHGAQLGFIAFFGDGMAPPTAPSPAGTFVWDELMTTDPAAAAAFYGAVIGWTPAPFDGPVDYTLFSAGDVQTGGMMQLQPGTSSGSPTSTSTTWMPPRAWSSSTTASSWRRPSRCRASAASPSSRTRRARASASSSRR